MTDFEFRELNVRDAYLINNFHIEDNRGGFTKIFEQRMFTEAGIRFHVNETFTSCSLKNVIRGLHFQTHNPQAKLVSIILGKVWDVIVDLRKNSPTYKQWFATEISASNYRAIFIPRGFAHGFVSLEDKSVMLYQCDGPYDKESDTGIIFNAPEIGITWPISLNDAIHSDRDLALMSFSKYEENPMS